MKMFTKFCKKYKRNLKKMTIPFWGDFTIDITIKHHMFILTLALSYIFN